MDAIGTHRSANIRPYYLRPDGKVGHDAFAVIRETIREMDKVAIGRVVLDFAIDELPLGGHAWMLVDEEAGHVSSKHGYLREIDPMGTRGVLVHLYRARQPEPREANAFAESTSTTE